MSPHLEIHPEVRDALANKQPVVALESTVITHGLPFPQNLEVALSLEAEVRAAGAIPATIALVNGKSGWFGACDPRAVGAGWDR